MFPKEINIGPIAVHLYGLIIALAIVLGWYVAKKRAKLYKIPENLFEDPLLTLPLVLGIIFARLYHIIDMSTFFR